MFRHFSLALLTTTTFLTPLHGSLAQQAETAECSIMTIVSDSGEISWNTDEAAGELIAIAKEIKFKNSKLSSYSVSSEKTINLNSLNYIFIRQDPPYNME